MLLLDSYWLEYLRMWSCIIPLENYCSLFQFEHNSCHLYWAGQQMLQILLGFGWATKNSSVKWHRKCKFYCKSHRPLLNSCTNVFKSGCNVPMKYWYWELAQLNGQGYLVILNTRQMQQLMDSHGNFIMFILLNNATFF